MANVNDIFYDLRNPLNEMPLAIEPIDIEGIIRELQPVKILLWSADAITMSDWSSITTTRDSMVGKIISSTDQFTSDLFNGADPHVILTDITNISNAKSHSSIVIPLIYAMDEYNNLHETFPLILTNNNTTYDALNRLSLPVINWRKIVSTEAIQAKPEFNQAAFKSSVTTRALVLLYRMPAELGIAIVKARPKINFFWLGHPGVGVGSNCQALPAHAQWAGMIQRAKICLTINMDENGRNYCLTNEVPFIQQTSSQYGGSIVQTGLPDDWLVLLDSMIADYSGYQSRMNVNTQITTQLDDTIIDSIVQIVYKSEIEKKHLEVEKLYADVEKLHLEAEQQAEQLAAQQLAVQQAQQLAAQQLAAQQAQQLAAQQAQQLAAQQAQQLAAQQAQQLAAQQAQQLAAQQAQQLAAQQAQQLAAQQAQQLADQELADRQLAEKLANSKTLEPTKVIVIKTSEKSSQNNVDRGLTVTYDEVVSSDSDEHLSNRKHDDYPPLIEETIRRGDELLMGNLYDSAQYYYHVYLNQLNFTRANMALAYCGLVRCHIQAGIVNESTLHYVQLSHLLSTEAREIETEFSVDIEHLLVLHLLNRDQDTISLMSEFDRRSQSLTAGLYLQMAQVHQDRGRYELALHYYDRALEQKMSDDIVLRRFQCVEELSSSDNGVAASSS